MKYKTKIPILEDASLVILADIDKTNKKINFINIFIKFTY